MTQTITIDGTARTTVVKRSESEWAESAYLGEIGSGSLKIHDDAGSISVVGHKTIAVDQDACSDPHVFHGFVARKGMGRGQTYSVGASREITVATKDGNDLLTRYIIQGVGAANGNRPAETVAARVSWILGSAFLSGLVNDHGAITSVTTLGMDATDYRGQRPGDVLAACAKKANFNYYVRWNTTNSDWELVFRDDNASTADTSTITITNDGTANGTSSFAPFQDAELTQDPEDVYSGVYATYAKGNVYRTRAATATAFVARDGTTDDSGIKTAAAATDEADTFLWESHLEEVALTLTIRMRAAYVGLIQAGQRVSVKMTHYAQEGYGSATYFRVLRKRVRQPLDTDNDYDVQLDLSPQESAPPAAVIVQSAFGRTGTAFGNMSLTLPNPVTIGNHLLVLVARRDDATPDAPNTDIAFPRFGAGAWTRLDGTDTNAITVSSSGAGEYDGVAGYWKTADSTSQVGQVGASYALAGIWEIAGADMASATVAAISAQTTTSDPAVFNIGSLGTGAVGDVAMMLAAWSNNVDSTGGRHEYIPLPAISSGVWTERYYKGAYTFSYGVHPAEAHPDCWFGDTAGTGAALAASVSKPKAEPYGSVGTTGWCGIAIRVPPL